MAGQHTIDVTDASFEKEVKEHKGLVLIDFWAPWCPPCRALAPMLEDFAKDRPDVKVVKVNVDENPGLSANVRSIPTLVLFRDGEAVDGKVGAPPSKKALNDWVNEHAGAAPAQQANPSAPKP